MTPILCGQTNLILIRKTIKFKGLCLFVVVADVIMISNGCGRNHLLFLKLIRYEAF